VSATGKDLSMPTPRKTPKTAPRAPVPATLDEVAAELTAPVADTAADKVAEMDAEIESPALNPVIDFQDQIRLVTEEGLEKSKLVYARSREVAEEATASLSASLKAVAQGVTDLNVKTVEAFQASADAQFAFVKALLSTKNLSDIFALQGEHIRQQIETLNAAAQDVSCLIQKVSTETVEPLKATLTKSLKIAA